MITLYTNNPTKNPDAFTSSDPTVLQSSPDEEYEGVIESGSDGGGGVGFRSRYFYPETYRKQMPTSPNRKVRSESADERIKELTAQILETGIVRNTHEEYDPRSNRRFKVSLRQAERVAYEIAKEEGRRVGKFQHSRAHPSRVRAQLSKGRKD